MSTDWHIVTSRLLKPQKQRLINVTSFKIFKSLYSLSVLFKCTKSFGPFFFQIVWLVEFMRPNYQATSAFMFPFSIFHISVTLPLMLKTFTYSSLQPPYDVTSLLLTSRGEM